MRANEGAYLPSKVNSIRPGNFTRATLALPLSATQIQSDSFLAASQVIRWHSSTMSSLPMPSLTDMMANLGLDPDQMRDLVLNGGLPTQSPTMTPEDYVREIRETEERWKKESQCEPTRFLGVSRHYLAQCNEQVLAGLVEAGGGFRPLKTYIGQDKRFSSKPLNRLQPSMNRSNSLFR